MQIRFVENTNQIKSAYGIFLPWPIVAPHRFAIQVALLSSFNCLSNLPATSRLRAASLAWGEITFSFWGRTS